MGQLFLLRHGRADPGNDDAARPLAERGRDDVARLGRFLHRQKLMPATILCSNALRTRETAHILCAQWQRAPEMLFLPELYLCEPETIAAVIRHDGAATTRPGADALMIVGHNPGIGAYARTLAGGTEPALDGTFQTSALALFATASANWQDWDGKTARLERFIRRSDLYSEE